MVQFNYRNSHRRQRNRMAGCSARMRAKVADHAVISLHVNDARGIFGWSGGGMAALCARNADRARLGQQAAGMLVKNDPATSMLSPKEKVGAPIAILKQKQ